MIYYVETCIVIDIQHLFEHHLLQLLLENKKIFRVNLFILQQFARALVEFRSFP